MARRHIEDFYKMCSTSIYQLLGTVLSFMIIAVNKHGPFSQSFQSAMEEPAKTQAITLWYALKGAKIGASNRVPSIVLRGQ